jgi:hypothetical protein
MTEGPSVLTEVAPSGRMELLTAFLSLQARTVRNFVSLGMIELTSLQGEKRKSFVARSQCLA